MKIDSYQTVTPKKLCHVDLKTSKILYGLSETKADETVVSSPFVKRCSRSSHKDSQVFS